MGSKKLRTQFLRPRQNLESILFGVLSWAKCLFSVQDVGLSGFTI